MKQRFLNTVIILAATPMALMAAQTESFSAKDLKKLHLRNLSGDVILKASNSKKAEVSYEKIKFSDKCEMEIKRKPKTLEIEVEKDSKRWNNDCKVNFTISLPKKTDLQIDLGSGDVDVSNIEGEVEINMGSGDLTYNSPWIDELTVKSGSGDMEIKGIAGEADIITGSGDVDLEYAKLSVPAALSVKSGSGRIEAVGLKGDADIITGSGRIELAYSNKMEDKGEISLKSGSGNSQIYFPKSLDAVSVDHKAFSGRVKSSIAQKSDAPWTVYMRSASGNLKIDQN